MTLKEKAIVYLDGLTHLEYKHKRSIIDLYDDIGTLFENPSICYEYLLNNASEGYAKTFIDGFKRKIYENIISEIENSGYIVVTEQSKLYPTSLLNIDFRPLCLYCLGNVNLLSVKNKLSIVGSRKTLPEYLKYTTNIAGELSNSGVVIVTGVANGADKSAILGALDSGNLIVVLAGGLNYIDSEQNRDLIKKVAKNGLVITEYAPSVPHLAYHYPIRNRIIAGLSLGVLICSGNNKSGTRYTADYAVDYNKDVFCFPYALGINSGELCNKLIKQGAYLTESVEDISSICNFSVNKVQKASLNSLEEQVYLEIKNGTTKVEFLTQKLNLKIYEILPLLSSLEIKGYVIKNNSNEYIDLL